MRAATTSLTTVIGLLLVVGPLTVEAQPPPGLPRIGVLRLGSPPDPTIEAFRQGLHALGVITAYQLGPKALRALRRRRRRRQ